MTEDCGVEGILAQSKGSVICQEQVGCPTIGGYRKTMNDLRNVCTGKVPFIQRGSSKNSYTHAWGPNSAHLLHGPWRPPSTRQASRGWQRRTLMPPGTRGMLCFSVSPRKLSVSFSHFQRSGPFCISLQMLPIDAWSVPGEDRAE